jgi:hypothetical protein
MGSASISRSLSVVDMAVCGVAIGCALNFSLQDKKLLSLEEKADLPAGWGLNG